MVRIKGTEEAEGYRVKTVIINPGAKAANANIPLPTPFNNAQSLVSLIVFSGSDGTVAAAATTYTINPFGTATNATGEASLYNANNLRVGDALTTRDIIIAILRYRSFVIEI